MALDFWNPQIVVNFRDVGLWVAEIGGSRLLPSRKFYRGGMIKHGHSPEAFGSPHTVFNLTNGPDPTVPGAVTYDFPISDKYDRYVTGDPEVRRWLTDVALTVAAGVEYPLFVHCNSGKDRTGVVTACFLLILEVPVPVIVEEYLLSEGGVEERSIRTAIDGIGNVKDYLSRVDLDAVRRALRGVDSAQPFAG
jgi:protein-tyrosine phosphatase